MFEYFYNETLKKLTLAFGGLFDEIFVSTTMSNGQVQKTRVPLTYSGKEKFIRRLTEASSISNNVKIETLLPRLAFEMGNLTYDPIRKVNKINRKHKTVGTGQNAVTYKEYSEVPYNIQFNLFCFTRSIEDNLQIIEQIIPYFSPEFIVTLKMNNLDTNIDVPIVLNGVNFSDTYEGDMNSRRVIISSMSFTAKAHIFGKIATGSSGIIKEANINIFEDET